MFFVCTNGWKVACTSRGNPNTPPRFSLVMSTSCCASSSWATVAAMWLKNKTSLHISMCDDGRVQKHMEPLKQEEGM